VSRQENILHVWLCHKYSRELQYAPRHIKISHKRLYNKYSKITPLCVKICHKSYMPIFVMITSRYYKNCQYMSCHVITLHPSRCIFQSTSCSAKTYHNLNWQDGQILQSTVTTLVTPTNAQICSLCILCIWYLQVFKTSAEMKFMN
jgi:hypothetical protein